MNSRRHPEPPVGLVYRAIGAAFGVLLLGFGCFVLLTWHDALQLLGAALLLALGGNLLFAAWRGTRNWLSKIGPLP